MKKNTKGFTLIELLAVIVILAIIALIAVPVVMNLLTSSRKSAAEDTVYSVLNAAELYYAEQLLENPTEAFAATEFTFNTNGDKPAGLNVKGTIPTGGKVTVDANGSATISSELTVNGFKCNYKTGSTTEVECK